MENEEADRLSGTREKWVGRGISMARVHSKGRGRKKGGAGLTLKRTKWIRGIR